MRNKIKFHAFGGEKKKRKCTKRQKNELGNTIMNFYGLRHIRLLPDFS